jgi:hypothetical protein
MNMPEAAITALKSGRTIQAIHAVREATGLGLKEAKEAVEKHIEGDPALRAQLASKKVSMPGVSTIVITICVLVIVYMLIWGG